MVASEKIRKKFYLSTYKSVVDVTNNKRTIVRLKNLILKRHSNALLLIANKYYSEYKVVVQIM
jgi:hypothetical protein